MRNRNQQKITRINFKKTRCLLIGVCLLIYMPFYGQQNNASACAIGSLPSVQYKSNSTLLSPTAKTILENVARQVANNPGCKVKVVGYGANSKNAQQLSWDHVNTVIRYLVEQQGISENRFIFSYGMDGNPTSVDLVPTTEEGPETAPAPHPHLINH